MNFGFSEEQELLRKTARDFLSNCASMTRVREAMEGDERTALEIWRRMSELGWPGLAFPEGVGGAGMGMVELCVVLEELGRALAPIPFLPTVLAGVAILEAGDEEQQQTWLSQICDGSVTGTLAITEERGSDEPADLNLRARMDGDRWRLDGRKLFVPDATLGVLPKRANEMPSSSEDLPLPMGPTMPTSLRSASSKVAGQLIQG